MRAHLGHVEAVGFGVNVAPRAARRLLHERPQGVRHGGLNLRDEILGGLAQHGVGVARDPLRAGYVERMMSSYYPDYAWRAPEASVA